MWLQLHAVKLSQVIYSFLVKPNRMFGLVEASAWMHVRNGTIKMSKLLGSESDPVSVFLLTFSSDQEKVKSPKGRNTKLQLLIKQ